MLRLLLLIFVCSVFFLKAAAQQNLVPNPSFEDTLACPMSKDGIENLAHWFSAKYSPDYFSICANNQAPYVGVPNNFVGFQLPMHGHAYAGLATFAISPPPLYNYREIIETPLNKSLTVGEKYYVSAYISSAMSENDDILCFSNSFGFRFTNVRHSAYINIAPEAPTDNFSHVRSINIVTDTSNWVWVGGEFIADSAYQYLMLGNFYDDENTDTICWTKLNANNGAYYYIDNVCVSIDSTENLLSSITKPIGNTFEIYAFPNPAKNILNIKNDKHFEHLVLLNSLGQKIMEDKLIDGLNTIDISLYARGIYFLLVNGSATKILFTN